MVFVFEGEFMRVFLMTFRVLIIAFSIGTAPIISPGWAHQCVLEGSTQDEVQAYNMCKADLATGTAGHSAQQSSTELNRLQAENEALRARLDVVKRQLLNLIGDL